MRRLGRGGGWASGRSDKLLIVGLWLLVVLLLQFVAPIERPGAAGGGGAALSAPTPNRTVNPPALGEGTALAPSPAEAAPSPEPTSVVRQPDPPYWRVETGGAGANMRREPGRTAPIIQQLRDGTVVTNLDQQQVADGLTWRHIALGDVPGWIDAELLAPQYD